MYGFVELIHGKEMTKREFGMSLYSLYIVSNGGSASKNQNKLKFIILNYMIRGIERMSE